MTQSLSNQISAEKQNGRYKFIRFVDRYIEISSSGKVEIFASVRASHEASGVGIAVYLQRFDGDWTTIKQWNLDSVTNYCSLIENTNVDAKEEYRIEVYYSAQKGSYLEQMMDVAK